MQAITPFLWLDDRIEEAVNHWTSVFPDSRIVSISRSGGPDGPGTVVSATFVLRGQEIMALNGGPHYRLTPAFSLFVRCETQEEIDRSGRRSSTAGRRSSAAGSPIGTG